MRAAKPEQNSFGQQKNEEIKIFTSTRKIFVQCNQQTPKDMKRELVGAILWPYDVTANGHGVTQEAT